MPLTHPLRIACLAAVLACPHAAALNNCSGQDFGDYRARRNVNINVQPPFRYSPSCVRISIDTTITFNADFEDHPLFGGRVSGGVAMFDPASPVGAHTSGTAPVIVSFAEPGEFPYFCDRHFDSGMQGSILVVPEFFSDGFE